MDGGAAASYSEASIYWEALLFWGIVLLPLIIGLAVWLARLEFAVAWTNALERWLAARRQEGRDKGGFWSKYIYGPPLWCCGKLFEATSGMADRHLAAGLRLGGWLFMLYAVGLIIYLAVAVVIALVITEHKQVGGHSDE